MYIEAPNQAARPAMHGIVELLESRKTVREQGRRAVLCSDTELVTIDRR
jgi:hypothetical protein